MQFGQNHPRGCSQGSTSPDGGKSQRENTCSSLLGNRDFSILFLRRERDAGCLFQTWNRQELLVFTHRSWLRFQFSINKRGPAHPDLPAPWQEPEVGGAIAGVAHLGKQAESVSTFCPLIKKKNKCIQLPQPSASLHK